MNQAPQKKDISGVVLAGGKSSRFGQDKGLYMLDGKPMVMHAMQILQPVCGELMISSAREEAYRHPGVDIIADIYHDCGPLGGIHSALTHMQGEYLAVIGCDTPLVPAELYGFMLKHMGTHQVVIPTHGGHRESMCAIYNRRCLPLIEDAIRRRKYKIMDAIAPANVLFLDVQHAPFYHNRIFHNINYPDDIHGVSSNPG